MRCGRAPHGCFGHAPCGRFGHAPRKRAIAWVCGLLGLTLGGAAIAGGYDTPMLYSARHIGMGGTAIGSVDDPSALFHNPAGLARTQCFSGLADVSLLLAKIKGSPNSLALDTESELAVAPMFLLGAAQRLTPWLTAGLGAFPIASAGATYKYSNPNDNSNIEDTTRLLFLELTPALAVNLLDDRLRIGAGYRITYVSLQRYQGDRSREKGGTDFDLSGLHLAGFRVGAQWSFTDALSAGVVYRHKTRTKVTNETGRALSRDFTDVETDFVLASKLGGGVRADVADFGLALDVEYLFNSQNAGYPLAGNQIPSMPGMDSMRVEVANVFDWKNELTLRVGGEYRLIPAADGTRQLALRLGYVLDGKTTNERYPSAFGTPPGPSHVVTTGAGWRFGNWQMNVAYAYRFGSGRVWPEDLMGPDRKTCLFCGVAGQDPYRVQVHGLYVDASLSLP